MAITKINRSFFVASLYNDLCAIGVSPAAETRYQELE